MKIKIVRDTDFERVAEGVKPDSKRRVVLPKNLEGVTYHIYQNSLGQIVLDPQVAIPAYEAWLFTNKDALASVKRGLADAAAGRTSGVDPKSL